MKENYLSIANSTPLFFITLVPILIAVVQAILFLRLGIKEAKKIGIEGKTVNKVITNSAIFSIIPSLPILITLAVLMPILGKFIPWLRLSVIGSAMYESLVADMTVKSFGLTGLGDPNVTPTIFVSIVWVMSLSILAGPLLNVLFLKSYDGKLKSFKKSGGFLAIASGALFIGMLAIMGVPLFFDFSNPLGILTAVVAGLSVITLDRVAKNTGKNIISEFSFPVSMILGMTSAVLINIIF